MAAHDIPVTKEAFAEPKPRASETAGARFSTRILPLIAVLALLPFYWIAYQHAAVGFWNDDGLYVSSAQSLAQGHGYRIPSLPDNPPQTKYPILFPAILAVVFKLFPDFPANTWILKLIPLLATLGWLLASRRWIARFSNEATGTWTVILAASTPVVMTLSVSLLADSLFALLATLALIYAHDTISGSSGATRKAILAAIFAAGAFHAKTTGSAVILAILILFAIRRGWRSLVCFGAIAAGLCLPWIAWQAAQGTIAIDHYNSWQNYRTWQVLLNFPISQKLLIMGSNALVLILQPAMLPAALPSILRFVLALAFAALVAAGFFAERRIAIAHVFFLIYIGMMIAWAWWPVRFAATLLPLALYFASAGVRRIARTPSIVPFAAAALLCISLGGVAIQTLRSTAAGVAPMDDFHPRLDWPATLNAIDRAKTVTRSDAVILSSVDPSVWLYGERHALREMDLFTPLDLIYSRPTDLAGRRWPDFAAYLSQHGVTDVLDGPVMDETGAIRAQFIRELDHNRAGLLGPPLDLGGGYTLRSVARQ